MKALVQLEGIVLLYLIFCIIGCLVGMLIILLASTKRIPKKQEKDFHLFLDQKEERKRSLAKQAEALQRNY